MADVTKLANVPEIFLTLCFSCRWAATVPTTASGLDSDQDALQVQPASAQANS
jgi:hypothetical protein